MAPSSNEADQKLSRNALIALVVGSMVGSGIFALPASFGRTTGALGAMIAWAIAGTGMLMLAFCSKPCHTASRTSMPASMPTPRPGLATISALLRQLDTGWDVALQMSPASS